jgi:glutaconate CoA-transferase subunit A
VRSFKRDLRDAVADIPDGAVIGLGGFNFQNKPMDAVREIVRQGKRALTVICAAPASMDADLLIAAGAVNEIIVQSLSLERFGPVGPAFRQAAEQGAIKVVDLDQGCVTAGLRAAAYGIDSLVARSAGGADFARVAPDWFRPVTDPFTGRVGMAVRAMKPDFALIHATKADAQGHVQHEGSDFNDELLSLAARKVIFTVEREVSREEIERAPNRTISYAFNTAAVVIRPRGAAPCAAHSVYGYDEDGVKQYAHAAGEGRLAEYIRRIAATA